MTRLGSGADIVLRPQAVEAMISVLEDGAFRVGLDGVRGSDRLGIYYEIYGIGDGTIGMAVEMPEGGTSPDDGLASEFGTAFPDGVLAVVDHYAGEFAFYVSEGGVLRGASAVLSE